MNGAKTCDYCCARWRLAGPSPLPPVERTVEIGALARKAVMSRAKTLFGATGLPPVLSGHGLPPDAKHRHIFFLPEDADGDGLIDHVTAHLPGGFDNRTLRAMTTLAALWDGAHGEWRVIEHWVARPGEVLGSLIRPSRAWTSATPFLAPRHVTSRYSVADQIRWQCREMGFPETRDLFSMKSVMSGDRTLAPTDFRWQRPGRPQVPPDRRGSFWRLVFNQPIAGPLAVGYGCHFGLGLFRPMDG